MQIDVNELILKAETLDELVRLGAARRTIPFDSFLRRTLRMRCLILFYDKLAGRKIVIFINTFRESAETPLSGYKRNIKSLP